MVDSIYEQNCLYQQKGLKGHKDVNIILSIFPWLPCKQKIRFENNQTFCQNHIFKIHCKFVRKKKYILNFYIRR